MLSANVFRVMHFISAPSMDGLVRAQLQNNIKHNIEFRYSDIQKDGRNWVAWFLKDSKQSILQSIKVTNGIGND